MKVMYVELDDEEENVEAVAEFVGSGRVWLDAHRSASLRLTSRRDDDVVAEGSDVAPERWSFPPVALVPSSCSGSSGRCGKKEVSERFQMR